MGYTSQTFYLNGYTLNAHLDKRTECTEASHVEFLGKSGGELRKHFDMIEVCDNNKIILKNQKGQFAVLE